jgi:hypothetical protein
MQTPREAAGREGAAGAGIRYSLAQAKTATINAPEKIGGEKPETEENIARGMSPEAARRAAYLKFGNSGLFFDLAADFPKVFPN